MPSGLFGQYLDNLPTSELRHSVAVEFAGKLLQTYEEQVDPDSGQFVEPPTVIVSTDDDVVEHARIRGEPDPPKAEGERQDGNTIAKFLNELGPSERDILTALLWEPCYPLVIKGGIGVGKSTFVRHFCTTWGPELQTLVGLSKPVPPFYFDFNERALREDSAPLDRVIASCDRQFKAALNALGVSDAEVWLIRTVNAIDAIAKMTRPPLVLGEFLKEVDKLEEAQRYDRSQGNPLLDLAQLRSALMDSMPRRGLDGSLEWWYVDVKAFQWKALAERLRLAMGAKDPGSTRVAPLFVFDNIDRLAGARRTTLQQVAELAAVSRVATVLLARQSTFESDLGHDHTFSSVRNGFTGSATIRDFRGPIPLRVVHATLGSATGVHVNRVDASFNIKMHEAVARLRGLAWSDEQCLRLFKGLTGSSVRKAFALARRFIANSVYSFPDLALREGREPLSASHVARAILRDRLPTMQPAYGNEIDNLFRVSSDSDAQVFYSPLLKAQLLRCVNSADKSSGCSLVSLVHSVEAFGYARQAILRAINELRERSKRLLWCDSFRADFDEGSVEDVTLQRYGALHITSIGIGYLRDVITSPEYLTECVPSTRVWSAGGHERMDFGESGRNELLVEFLWHLAARELAELEEWCSALGTKAIDPGTAYLRSFGEIEGAVWMIARGLGSRWKPDRKTSDRYDRLLKHEIEWHKVLRKPRRIPV